MAQAREYSAVSAGERMTSNERFASKVDAWLLATLVVTAGLSLWAIGLVWTRTSSANAVVLTALIGLPGVVLPLWLLATSYELTSEELLVRSGPFRWRVPLAQVRDVVPSRSWLSAPALSLDRLRIDYARTSSLMISPKDKQHFIAELDARRASSAPAGR